MAQFDHTHYVPVLKGKEGEYSALRALSPDQAKHLTPLIEIPPIPWDFEDEEPAKSIDEHLSNVAPKISQSWPAALEVFVDLSRIPPGENLKDGSEPTGSVFAELRKAGVLAIPVMRPQMPGPRRDAIGAILAQDKRGVCLRLTGDDLDNDEEELRESLEQEMAALHLGPNEVDLVVDLGEIQPKTGLLTARAVLGEIPFLPAWRNLVLTATSFPTDLRHIRSDSVATIPRNEWSMWLALTKKPKGIPRLPSYGDYAIANPEMVEIDPRLMRMSAQLRYTAETEWVIAKGRAVRPHGYEQMAGIALSISSRHEFKGPGFSWGDEWIAATAQGKAGPGSATTWRKVGTNHHLALVVSQLASLRVS